MKMDNLQKQKNTITEKHLLQTELRKPIILVTYDQPVQIKKSVKVRTYDLKVDKDKMISKVDVLFAFAFEEYGTIKESVRLNKDIESQKHKPIPKPADRPFVASQQEYKAGTGSKVRITMRNGTVLTGLQVHATKYNLILNIADKHVLVYKHGILQYQIQTTKKVKE